MPRNRISYVDKQRLIDAHARHEDYVEVARLLGVARGTAYAIVRRHQQHGVVARPRGGAHNKRMDEEMVDTIVLIMEENSEYTIHQINMELRNRLPNKPHVCDNVIASCLNGRLITLKKIRDVPAQRNSPGVKAARTAMADWLLRNAQTEKIYIDESGFRLWLKRSMGRAPRGQPAFRLVNARQSSANLHNFCCVQRARSFAS